MFRAVLRETASNCFYSINFIASKNKIRGCPCSHSLLSLVETHCHLELPFLLWNISQNAVLGLLRVSCAEYKSHHTVAAAHCAVKMWAHSAGHKRAPDTTEQPQEELRVSLEGLACWFIKPFDVFCLRNLKWKFFFCNGFWRLKPLEKRRFGVMTSKLVPNSGIQTSS